MIFYNSTTNIVLINESKLSQLNENLLLLKIRLVVFGYVMLPMLIIGILLNGFTILVLLHPRMKNSTNVYLTGLSIANILCLINFVIFYSFRYIFSYEIFKRNLNGTQDSNSFESFINFIMQYWIPIFNTFQLFAIYLTCAVTVDRWVYLRWPMKADKICTIKVTLKIICLLFLFCFIYNLPRWFEIESQKIISTENKTYYFARITKLGENEFYRKFYQRYCYIIFVYGLPFSILLIVNIGIINKLIEAKKRKNALLGINKNYKDNVTSQQIISNTNNSTENAINSNTKNSKQLSVLDPKITLIVLAVVLSFFCCNFPYLILHIFQSTSANQKWFKFSKVFCDFLAALNCCINFLIYCFFGCNFRQIAKMILLNPSFNPYSQLLIQRHNSHKIFKNSNPTRPVKNNTEDLQLLRSTIISKLDSSR